MSNKIAIKRISHSHQSLEQFLEEHRTKEGEKITHTSWGTIMGKYSVPVNKIDTFHRLYTRETLQGKKFNLIEQHCEVGPVVVDIDFKFDINVMDRLYTKEHIKKIVKLYVNELKETFLIQDETNDLMAFVFEREKPYKFKGNTKDGIHIMFPFIVSEPEIQYLVRDSIIKKCMQEKIFDDLPLKNGLTDVFDRTVIHKNGWFLYRSGKPYCNPYEFTLVFDHNLQEIKRDEVDYRGINDLPKFLSIRRHKSDDCLRIRSSKLEELDKINKKQITFKLNRLKKLHNTHYDMKHISQLVDILSTERADEERTWMETGWCLHNIDPSTIELLNLWIDFSKKSQKFKNGECEKLWGKFRKDGRKLGIGSIYYWAKKDNPDKYLEIKRGDIRYYIEKSLNCTNYDIAKVLYEIFKDQYVCASIKNKTWYVFKDHRWYEDDDGINLRQKISTDLVYEYCRVISEYNEKWGNMDDSNELCIEEKEKEKNRFENKTKKLTSIIGKLKTTSFKDNIMKECKELFYNKSFIDKLDADPYLIGFENGVYDLKQNLFKDGEPEDYISLSTGNDYIEHDENNEYMDDINEFMKQILPNYEVREYVWKLLASILQGYNAEEKFRIWTGVGGNGKGKLGELFTLAFGEYTIKFQTTLLTGKRAASNAVTPELAQSKGKRYAYFDEPDENERINIGIMKEFTGGDKIKARALFKEPIEFKPQFKLILQCNDLPRVPPHDGGTWRRMEVVEFGSKFVDNPKEDNEYPIDSHLSEKLRDWRETFMSILLEYYKKYQKEGLKPPDEVVKFTKEYQKNCDMYAEFLGKIVEKGNKEDNVDMSHLYTEYKVWSQENNCKLTSRKDFREYLKKKYGKLNVTDDNLLGFKLKSDENPNLMSQDVDDSDDD